MACNDVNRGGYDYEFVDDVPEDYECGICFHPMKKPVQTHCGHRFCRECLEAALRRSVQYSELSDGIIDY